MVFEVKVKLVFSSDFNCEEFVCGFDEFSYIWLLFRFYEIVDKGYLVMVRFLCFGGNECKGVFVICVIFCLNVIGMSVVKLEGIEYKNG